MNRLDVCWVVLCIIFSCTATLIAQKRQKDFAKKAIRSSKHWVDIDYVGDGHIGHRLDIHLPEQKSDEYPVILCIYGSAWFSNNSKGAAFSGGVGQWLLKAGYAVVTINHRSSHDAKFPAQIHDVKAAVRFVRANAAVFTLDPNFIGITGWSSGGHLSALAGTSNGVDTFEYKGKIIDIEGQLGDYPQISSQVDAVVNWFGPTNFLMMDDCGSTIVHNNEKSPESALVGGAIQDNKETCHLADPATYISDQTPPFLLVHGDKDPLVPYCQSEYLYHKLESEGIDSRLVKVEGGEHGPGVLIPKYIEKMIAFFDEKRLERTKN